MRAQLFAASAAITLLFAGASLGQTGFTGHGLATPPLPPPPKNCIQQNAGVSLSNPGAAAACAGPVNNRTITIINGAQLVQMRFTISTAGGSTISQQLTAGSQAAIPIRVEATGTIGVDWLDVGSWDFLCKENIQDHGTGDIVVTLSGTAYYPKCKFAP
jgi:hypothetical protein